MPFTDNTHHAFTETGIAAFAPTVSGIYGIYNNGEWIYVGESENVETRLYEHHRRRSDQSSRIWARNPTGFVFERIVGEQARKARERALIAELRPTAN